MFELKNAQFLKDTGLLYEINRTVLNPLGYSMAVQADGTVTVIHTENEWTQSADGYALLRAFLRQPTVIAQQAKREKALGWTVQPNPKPSAAELEALYETINTGDGDLKCPNGHTVLHVDREAASDLRFTYGTDWLMEVYEDWRAALTTHRCEDIIGYEACFRPVGEKDFDKPFRLSVCRMPKGHDGDCA